MLVDNLLVSDKGNFYLAFLLIINTFETNLMSILGIFTNGHSVWGKVVVWCSSGIIGFYFFLAELFCQCRLLHGNVKNSSQPLIPNLSQHQLWEFAYSQRWDCCMLLKQSCNYFKKCSKFVSFLVCEHSLASDV